VALSACSYTRSRDAAHSRRPAAAVLREEGEPPAESADVDVLQMALREGGRSCGAAETALGQLKRSQSFA
jgi:hypothetical protein